MNSIKYAYAPNCEIWDILKPAKPENQKLKLLGLASQLFPDPYVGRKHTAEFLSKGFKTVVDAQFVTADGDFATVDFVYNKNNFYFVTESTTISSEQKRKAAFAVYAAEKDTATGGVKAENVYILAVDKAYVKHGKVKAIDFFDVIDITDDVKVMVQTVKSELRQVPKTTANSLSGKCSKCPHKNTCKGIFETNSDVMNLMRTSVEKKAMLMNLGCVTYKDALPHLTEGTTAYKQALAHIAGDRYTLFDPDKIAEWINNLEYPLYFLDFETLQECIPEFDGQKPFDQIPFQFSLHIQDKPGGALRHVEFLGDPKTDYREELVKTLVDSIGTKGSIIAYNASFEKNRIKEMAETFPAYKNELSFMVERFADLMDPFSKMWIYYPNQNGSYSIKHVLPSMFPCDPELDYSDLSQVHNGTEAMDTFREMKTMYINDYEEARRNMLNYCRLDTYAMVKILGKLAEIIK